MTLPTSIGDSEPVTMGELQYDKINTLNFHICLDLYQDHVRDVYQELEDERFENIPERLNERTPKYLDKEEVISMDLWMQKRGHQLMIAAHKRNQKLIESNEEDDIKQATQSAIEKYSRDNLFQSMKILEELHGIGQGRASLLLSVAHPDEVPFLSEKLRRWVLPSERTAQTNRQYRQRCFDRVEEMRLKMNVKAIDVEKVAFVLDCEEKVSGLKCVDIQDPTTTAPRIGQGTFGFVHMVDELAGHEKMGKVVIKRIPKIPVLKRCRLFAEILDSSLVSKESPQHFVQFIGWNEDQASYFLALEYMKPGDLDANLKNNPNWTEADYKDITRQLLNGLAIMHRARITHRDLKPQNILLVSNTPGRIRVKIADFGISKRRSDRGTTTLRTMTGTVRYMAPEVKERWEAEGAPQGGTRIRSYTEKVDLWSLGCVIYRTATKTELFLRGPPTPDGRQRVNKKLEEMHLEESGIELVKKLLEFEPLDRPSAETALETPWLTP
ncbi:hypothetical protein Hte_010098 [Hypoxylon texense]